MRKKALLFLVASVLCLGSLGLPVSAASSDKEIKPRRIELNVSTISLRVNQTRTLFAEVTPYDAEDKSVAWDSSNPEIVTVDDDGILTGVTPGTAQVTATTVNGRTATCTVTVSGYILGGGTMPLDTDIFSQPYADISGGEVLTAANLRAEVETALKTTKNVVLSYNDKTTVSTTALRSAAYAAQYSGGRVTIRFLTPVGQVESQPDVFSKPPSSSELQGWLTVYPDRAGEDDRDLKTRVVTSSTQTASAREQAASRLGASVAVVSLSQQGAFGMEVEVAAKVDLNGMNTASLQLYHLDSGGGYTLLPSQAYTLDENGFIHFTTQYGGVHVIGSYQ